jgi:hypothetical protein
MFSWTLEDWYLPPGSAFNLSSLGHGESLTRSTRFRKRASTRNPTLSNELEAIWTPLLTRLEDTHEGFIEMLLFRMVEGLGAVEDARESHLSSSNFPSRLTLYFLGQSGHTFYPCARSELSSHNNRLDHSLLVLV